MVIAYDKVLIKLHVKIPHNYRLYQRAYWIAYVKVPIGSPTSKRLIIITYVKTTTESSVLEHDQIAYRITNIKVPI